MKVRPTTPGAVIRFPSDPRRRVPDEGCEMPVSGVDAEHFHRLIRSKDLTVVLPEARIPAAPAAAPVEPAPDDAESTEPLEPTGREPLTPITTR
jgi:hypothetical protein